VGVGLKEEAAGFKMRKHAFAFLLQMRLQTSSPHLIFSHSLTHSISSLSSFLTPVRSQRSTRGARRGADLGCVCSSWEEEEAWLTLTQKTQQNKTTNYPLILSIRESPTVSTKYFFSL
jgi:hypothetical protein